VLSLELMERKARLPGHVWRVKIGYAFMDPLAPLRRGFYFAARIVVK